MNNYKNKYYKYYKYYTKYNNLLQFINKVQYGGMKQLDLLLDLFNDKDVWYDIAILTCGFCLDKSTDKLLDDIKKNKQICTELGKKISDVLLKDVIMHIFNIKEQFIVELIVNGFDAQNTMRNNKVGKFGVGFFSALSPLIKYNCILEITTCFKNNDSFLGYVLQIKYDTVFNFRIDKYNNCKKTGTVMTYKNISLSDEELLNIYNELHRLICYKNGKIFIKSDNDKINSKEYKLFNIINDSISNQSIFVILNNNMIMVQDSGIGIDPDTMLNKLLVPSSSTKKIDTYEIKSVDTDITNIFKSYDNKNHLIITVAGVAIVNLTTKYSGSNLYLIDLPSSFDLPVARNDIILKTPQIDIFINRLATLIRSKSVDLYILQDLINEYYKFTMQTEAVEIIKFKVMEIINNLFVDEYIPIPIHNSQLKYIIDVKYKLVSSQNINFEPLNNFINKKFADQIKNNKKLLLGKYIIYLDNKLKDDIIHYNEYVFINNINFIDSDNALNIVASYIDSELIPMILINNNIKIDVDTNKIIDKFLANLNLVSINYILPLIKLHVLKSYGYYYDKELLIFNYGEYKFKYTYIKDMFDFVDGLVIKILIHFIELDINNFNCKNIKDLFVILYSASFSLNKIYISNIVTYIIDTCHPSKLREIVSAIYGYDKKYNIDFGITYPLLDYPNYNNESIFYFDSYILVKNTFYRNTNKNTNKIIDYYKDQPEIKSLDIEQIIKSEISRTYKGKITVVNSQTIQDFIKYIKEYLKNIYLVLINKNSNNKNIQNLYICINNILSNKNEYNLQIDDIKLTFDSIFLNYIKNTKQYIDNNNNELTNNIINKLKDINKLLQSKTAQNINSKLKQSLTQLILSAYEKLDIPNKSLYFTINQTYNNEDLYTLYNNLYFQNIENQLKQINNNINTKQKIIKSFIIAKYTNNIFENIQIIDQHIRTHDQISADDLNFYILYHQYVNLLSTFKYLYEILSELEKLKVNREFSIYNHIEDKEQFSRIYSYVKQFCTTNLYCFNITSNIINFELPIIKSFYTEIDYNFLSSFTPYGSYENKTTTTIRIPLLLTPTILKQLLPLQYIDFTNNLQKIIKYRNNGYNYIILIYLFILLNFKSMYFDNRLIYKLYNFVKINTQINKDKIIDFIYKFSQSEINNYFNSIMFYGDTYNYRYYQELSELNHHYNIAIHNTSIIGYIITFIESLISIDNILMLYYDTTYGTRLNEKTYTLSNFISYLYNNNENDYRTIIEDNKLNNQRPLELQIIQIAVNYGSSNQPERSVAIELLQNSIDVINSKYKFRLYNDLNPREIFLDKFKSLIVNDNGKVNIKIGYKTIPGSDNMIMVYENTDYIGFSDLNNIISLSVPYYSEKNKDSAGQMGNGFFNVYKNSSKVLIRSISDAVNFNIEDIPIYNDNKVIDIQKTITYYAPKKIDEQNLTSITVFYKEKSFVSFNYLAQSLYYELNDMFSSIPYINIRLNDIQINNNAFQIYGSQYFKFFLKEKNDSISYVLCHGVPFIRLDQFLNKFTNINKTIILFASTGYILDINGLYYSPVQSRIDAEFDIKLIQEINTLLIDLIFNGILTRCALENTLPPIKEINRKRGLFIIDQILPNTAIDQYTSMDSFITTHKFQYNDKILNIAELIRNSLVHKYNKNICELYYSIMSTIDNNITKISYSKLNTVKLEQIYNFSSEFHNDFIDLINRISDENILSSNFTLINYVDFCITKWLTNKFLDINGQIIDYIKIKATEYNLVIIDNYQKGGGLSYINSLQNSASNNKYKLLFETFMISYINILIKSGVTFKYDKMPQFDFIYDNYRLGAYYLKGNCLYINLLKFYDDIKNLFNFIIHEKMDAIKYIRGHPSYIILFSGLHYATIIHELEHYRRYTSHDGVVCEITGFHDSSFENLPIFGAKERTFNASLVDLYKIAIKNNLINDWITLFLQKIDSL